MLSKEDRLEVIEIIKEAVNIVLEKQEEKNKLFFKEQEEKNKLFIKTVMDYQTDRFLNLINNQQRMLERLDKLVARHEQKFSGFKDVLDNESDQ